METETRTRHRALPFNGSLNGEVVAGRRYLQLNLERAGDVLALVEDDRPSRIRLACYDAVEGGRRRDRYPVIRTPGVGVGVSKGTDAAPRRMVLDRGEPAGIIRVNLMKLRFRSRARRSRGGGNEFAQNHPREGRCRYGAGKTNYKYR